FMDSIHLNEWMLYGSSRLGSKDVKIVTAAIKLDALANGPNLSEQSYFEDTPDLLTISETNSEFWRGQKRYELSNHLGNVLAVVSDKKTAVYTNTQTPTFSHYSAEVIQATDYSPFGAPLPSRSYTYNKFDKVVVDLYPNNMNLAGWQTIFCTNPNSCVSPETSVTLTESAGKLKIEATKRYSQAYYTFTTVPGRVYRVKYKLSNSTILMVNTSLFAPVSKTELYTSANVTTFDVDREMIFTATETSTRFYITKGWSASSTTPLQEITLDYLTIVEIPSQINYISCTSLNQNLTMLSNSGVNINDSNAVKGYLNGYYNAQFSYFAYQQVISNCATFAGSYVLPRKGTEADFVESAYRFGFNGKEKDNDTYGEGNAYDFGARIYDSRLGRWLSVDPFQNEYPGFSGYNYSLNNPIALNDQDGKWVKKTITKYDANCKIIPIYKFWVKAKTIEVSYEIHKAKLYNGSSLAVSPDVMEQAAKKIQSDITGRLSTSTTSSDGSQTIIVNTTFADDI
ncbi:MAG: RHS repeat-associated core domain-containing protein, partial [Bacteroidia bacterium]